MSVCKRFVTYFYNSVVFVVNMAAKFQKFLQSSAFVARILFSNAIAVVVLYLMLQLLYILTLSLLFSRFSLSL